MKMRRIILVMILVLISSNKVMAAHPTNMPKRFEVKSFLFGISNTDDLYLDVEVGDDGYFKMIIPELEWTSGIGKHKTTKLTVVGQAFCSLQSEDDKIPYNGNYVGWYLAPINSIYGSAEILEGEIEYLRENNIDVNPSYNPNDPLKNEVELNLLKITNAGFYSNYNLFDEDEPIDQFTFFFEVEGTYNLYQLEGEEETIVSKPYDELYSNVRYLSVDAINFKNELCYYGEEVDDIPLMKDDFIDLDDDAKTNEIIKTIIAILVALGVIGSGSVIIINKAKPSKSDPEPNNGNGPSPNLGKWVKFDEDYDLIATDPVTGEERVFVDKGNGLYTEPVSGISYTQEELVNQMYSREENKALIQRDLDQTKQAIKDHREQNKELSEIGQKLKAEQDKINQERAYENYVRSVGNKLGMYDASEKEIRDALADKIIKEDKFRQEIHKAIEKMDTFIAGAETIVIASDTVMTYGEVFGGAAGKAVAATYKGTKGLAVNLAEKGISVSSVSEGLTKGATDAAGTIMKPGVGKATAVIGGTISSELITNPGDIGMAINTGIIKGITNVSIGTPSDVAGVTGKKGIEFLIKLQEDKIKKGMSDLVDQAAEQVIKEELAKQKK